MIGLLIDLICYVIAMIIALISIAIFIIGGLILLFLFLTVHALNFLDREKNFGRHLPHKPRWLNKWWAKLSGKFWLPCPLCHEYMGGHEWEDEAVIWVNQNYITGVCDKCMEEAKQLNKARLKAWGLEEEYQNLTREDVQWEL